MRLLSLAQKYLERYAVAPIEANFNLDAKDGSLALADFVRINSRQYQDFYGNNQDLLLQIVKRKEALVGTTWAFTARQFAFSSNANPDRIVDIAVDTWDLDLKAAHDDIYSPAISGDVVIVTIQSRCACYRINNIALRYNESEHMGGWRYRQVGHRIRCDCRWAWW